MKNNPAKIIFISEYQLQREQARAGYDSSDCFDRFAVNIDELEKERFHSPPLGTFEFIAPNPRYTLKREREAAATRIKLGIS